MHHFMAIAARVFLALLTLLLIRPTFAHSLQQKRYVVSVGTPSDKLVSGTFWLYSYSWYGLKKYKLAAIQNGFAVVPLDIDRLRREADPHPNTSGYVVVIQAGEHLWFRSPDIAPDKFWTDLQGTIRLMGGSTDLRTGETQLGSRCACETACDFSLPGRTTQSKFRSQRIHLSVGRESLWIPRRLANRKVPNGRQGHR